jgi:hypothetical protein
LIFDWCHRNCAEMGLQKVNFSDGTIEANFRRKGYTSLCQIPIVTLAETEALYEMFLVLWNNTGFYSSMMINNPDYRRAVTEGMSAIITPILDSFITNYEILFVNFLVKLPNDNNYIGVHQDWNFVDEQQAEALNFWFPLVDVNDENGNLYMLESSQDFFKQTRGTPYVNYFSGFESAMEQTAVPLNPNRGQMLLYQGRIVHFSRPNLSGRARVAIGGVLIPRGVAPVHYRYVQTGKWRKYFVNKSFFESFLPEGEITGYDYEEIQPEKDYFSENVRQAIVKEYLNARNLRKQHETGF